ncbi:hypothetical protein G9F72_013580 [Clostridium estertheticum]|nr:hypothetical protein [Clostridium estertheticum]MBZ9687358.1 hypothetical protein [Clostridium estertheticum]
MKPWISAISNDLWVFLSKEIILNDGLVNLKSFLESMALEPMFFRLVNDK